MQEVTGRKSHGKGGGGLEKYGILQGVYYMTSYISNSFYGNFGLSTLLSLMDNGLPWMSEFHTLSLCHLKPSNVVRYEKKNTITFMNGNIKSHLHFLIMIYYYVPVLFYYLWPHLVHLLCHIYVATRQVIHITTRP